MNEAPQFRTGDEEVSKLLQEVSELRQTLKAISGQLGRMENRIRLAFPKISAQRPARRPKTDVPSLSSEQASLKFESLVQLASDRRTVDAERELEDLSGADLQQIARQIGASFPSTKPSVKALREGILGKIREAVLLGRQFHRA